MKSNKFTLDKATALAGALSSIILALFVGLQSGNPLYLLTALLAFASCCIWIMKGSKMKPILTPSPMPRVALLLVACFLFLLTASVWSVYLRPQTYQRPTVFFVLVALMVGVITFQIFVYPASNRRFTSVIVLQTILVGVLLNWTEVLIFPGVVGIDPAFYRLFTLKILGSGHIPTGSLYSSFPTTQLATSALMLSTGTRYEIATMFSIGLVQIVAVVMLTYLLGKSFTQDERLGLLASLVLVTANRFVEFGWWATPTTLASIFIVVSYYLLAKPRIKAVASMKFLGLILLFGFVLIVTHTVTAVALCLSLFVSWAVGLFRKPLSLVVIRAPLVRLGIPLVLSVSMLAWWAYAARNALRGLGDVIRSGFTIDAFYQGPLYVGYLQSVPIIERAVDNLGFVAFFTFSLFGGLHFLAKKELNSLAFAASGLGLLFLGFVSPVLGREILNVRWWYYAQILLAVPAAVGLVLVVGLLRNHHIKRFVVILVVGCVSFLMITSTASNSDNSPFSPNLATRVAFTESEFAAAAFVSSHWFGEISSDFEYATNPSSSVFINYYNISQGRIKSLDLALVNKDFSGLNSVVLVRSAIVDHPFALAGGLNRLDYDPNAVLAASGFDRIYDSSSVIVYVHPP